MSERYRTGPHVPIKEAQREGLTRNPRGKGKHTPVKKMSNRQAKRACYR